MYMVLFIVIPFIPMKEGEIKPKSKCEKNE